MKTKQTRRWPIRLLFALYCLVLLNIVFYRFSPWMLLGGGWEPVRSVNWIPLVGLFTDFQDVSPSVIYYNIVGNIAIFVPLGIFLQIFRRDKSVGKCLLTVVLVSLAVETVQFALGVGISDIDDILLNALGGLIGILLCRLAYRIAGERHIPDIALLCLCGGVPTVLAYAGVLLMG